MWGEGGALRKKGGACVESAHRRVAKIRIIVSNWISGKNEA